MVAEATGCRPKFIAAGRLAVAADFFCQEPCSLLQEALQPTALYARGTAAYCLLRFCLAKLGAAASQIVY
jgi:hypothetical protein